MNQERTAFERMMLTFRTVRHLRARQMLDRLRRAVVKQPRPRPVSASWNALRAQKICSAIASLGTVDTPTSSRRRVAAWRDGRAEMLGQVQPVPRTWREGAVTPLFGYHLQYHDTLSDAAWVAHESGAAAPVDEVASSVRQWIAAWNGGGSPAWDSYPIAVRSVNWMRMIAWGALDVNDPAMQASLATQIDVLARGLEWHLEGNHLLRDAWALAIVPACFSGSWAESTWRAGRELYWRTLLDQVDEHGVHEERTPMYQARILRDALEVVAVMDALGEEVPQTVRARTAAMAVALEWMLHANGSLRLVNDSAGDHGIDLERLLRSAERVTGITRAPRANTWFPETARFAAVRDAVPANALFVDLGGPSPPHQPGHSHAAALSFEYDLGGLPLVVDGGCSGYDGDAWRPYFRGTAAHNTVVVDGLDQSEMWETFRVARRAHVDGVAVTAEPSSAEVRGRCRPYHRRGTVHERALRYGNKVLTINDVVRGARGCGVESFLHFDPAWTASRTADGVVALTHASARAIVRVEGSLSLSLHRGEETPKCGWSAAGFNHVVPAWCVRLATSDYDGTEWRVSISTD